MTDTQQYPKREQIAPLPDDARMDAYYYGFERTGVGFIDAILSAVAIAGKGAHHTEGWYEEGNPEYYRGRPGLPDADNAVDLIQKAAQQAADAVMALFPQPTPSADTEVEYALDVDGSTLSVSTELTDPEELQGHIPGSTVVSRTVTYTEWVPVDQPAEPCCARPGDPNWHTADGGHVVPPVVEEDTPVAEPVSIADMAPGTTFTARHVDPDECGGVDHRWFVIRPGAQPLVISDEGQHWSGSSIDPSTIRDVTPPPMTPEA